MGMVCPPRGARDYLCPHARRVEGRKKGGSQAQRDAIQCNDGARAGALRPAALPVLLPVCRVACPSRWAETEAEETATGTETRQGTNGDGEDGNSRQRRRHGSFLA